MYTFLLLDPQLNQRYGYTFGTPARQDLATHSDAKRKSSLTKVSLRECDDTLLEDIVKRYEENPTKSEVHFQLTLTPKKLVLDERSLDINVCLELTCGLPVQDTPSTLVIKGEELYNLTKPVLEKKNADLMGNYYHSTGYLGYGRR